MFEDLHRCFEQAGASLPIINHPSLYGLSLDEPKLPVGDRRKPAQPDLRKGYEKIRDQFVGLVRGESHDPL